MTDLIPIRRELLERLADKNASLHHTRKAQDELRAAIDSAPCDPRCAETCVRASMCATCMNALATPVHGETVELWAVHAQGSDDIYPAFSKEDAEKHASELNALPMPEGIAVGAVVVHSPWPAAEHWEYLAEEERDHKEQIMALAAQQPKPAAVQEGYVLVPVEPTPEMANASVYNGTDYTGSFDFDDFKKDWTDILAATPAPVQAHQQVADGGKPRKMCMNGDTCGNHCSDDEEFHRCPIARQVTLPKIPTEKMLSAYRNHASHWMSLDGWRAMLEVAPCAPAPVAEPASLSAAARDVLAERQRQISAEGWTPEHDDEHGDGSMALAASCYACASAGFADAARDWPWSDDWFKPSSPRRDLIKAGALILAEIERLDRAAAPSAEGGE